MKSSAVSFTIGLRLFNDVVQWNESTGPKRLISGKKILMSPVLYVNVWIFSAAAEYWEPFFWEPF